MAYKAARWEVIEWILNHKFTFPAEVFPLWQAKLKDWGIEQA